MKPRDFRAPKERPPRLRSRSYKRPGVALNAERYSAAERKPPIGGIGGRAVRPRLQREPGARGVLPRAPPPPVSGGGRGPVKPTPRPKPPRCVPRGAGPRKAPRGAGCPPDPMRPKGPRGGGGELWAGPAREEKKRGRGAANCRRQGARPEAPWPRRGHGGPRTLSRAGCAAARRETPETGPETPMAPRAAPGDLPLGNGPRVWGHMSARGPSLFLITPK
jgi:hypothetical protein